MRERLENDKEIDKYIGERIRNYRKFLGIGRREIAEAFSVTEDAVYRIESGTNGLSGTYGYILAHKFNFDMEYIYGKKEVLECVDSDVSSLDNNEILSRVMFYIEMLKGREEGNT